MENVKKHAMKEGIITGVSTAVLCLILFVLTIKSNIAFSEIFLDLSLTVGVTAFLCGVIQVFIIKGNVKKGKAPEISNLNEQISYYLLPKNIMAFLLYYSAVCLLLFCFAPIGIVGIFAMESGEVSKVLFIILKSGLSGASGGYVTYHAHIFISKLLIEKAQMQK